MEERAEILEGQISIEDTLKNIEEKKEEKFVIKDKSTATWWFKRIKYNNDKVKEIEAIEEEQINAIKKWAMDEKKHYDNSFCEFALQEYYRQERAEDPKFRLSTPFGKLSVRKTLKYNYDEEVIKNYLKENHLSELIRVKEEIDKTKIKKEFKDGVNPETGEIIPGLEVIENESFTIKIE